MCRKEKLMLLETQSFEGLLILTFAIHCGIWDFIQEPWGICSLEFTFC